MKTSTTNTARAFTLVELLTVMAIMVLLIGLVASALRYSRGPSLTSAGQKLSSLLAVARQNSIAKNALTAVVLLGQQGTEADFRTFTLLEYRPDQGKWKQISPWEKLPQGVVVDCGNSGASTFLANSPSPFPFLAAGEPNPPVKYEGKAITGSNGYAARIFLPNGGLQNPEVPATIRLVEGAVQNGQLILANRDQGGSANFYDLTIIGAVGSVKTSRPHSTR